MSDDDPSPEKDAGPSVPPGALSRELPIINKRGLHARASAKFVQMVERFNAEVWVTKGHETVAHILVDDTVAVTDRAGHSCEVVV